MWWNKNTLGIFFMAKIIILLNNSSCCSCIFTWIEALCKSTKKNSYDAFHKHPLMYQNYFIASTAPCYLFPTCTIVSMYLLSLIFQTWCLNYIILSYIYLQYCHKLYFFTMLIKESKSPFSRKICHYYVKFYIAEDELPIKIKLVFILAHFFCFCSWYHLYSQ